MAQDFNFRKNTENKNITFFLCVYFKYKVNIQMVKVDVVYQRFKVNPSCDHCAELPVERYKDNEAKCSVPSVDGIVHYPASDSRHERGRMLCQSAVRSSPMVTDEFK